MNLMVFEVEGQNFGLEISEVIEVLPLVAISAMSRGPLAFEGFINLRGEVLPVIDFRKRFGFKTKACNLNDQLVVARIDEQNYGIIVDRVTGVIEVEPEKLISDPKTMSQSQLIAGVLELDTKLLMVVDVACFLEPESAFPGWVSTYH